MCETKGDATIGGVTMLAYIDYFFARGYLIVRQGQLYLDTGILSQLIQLGRRLEVGRMVLVVNRSQNHRLATSQALGHLALRGWRQLSF